jgi:MinD-like ATPase involved in chromosome partitioning or flagellar assembly
VSQQLAALRRHLGDAPPAPVPAIGGAVVVGSGKGGVGTSSVAALLALLAAAHGARTLLVDSDEGVGPLGLMLGVADAPGWAALRGGAHPDALLVRLGERLSFLPGGAPADAAALSPTERRALFRRVASLYPTYDLVVVDGGSRLEPVLAACGAGVARLLAVTTPDRIALAGCYALLKAVDARHPGVAAGLVINQCDAAGAERAAATVAEAAQLFLGRAVALAAAVPDDLCLRAGMQAGMCLQDAADGSPAAVSLLALADRLIDQPVAAVPPAVTRTL